MTNLIRSVIIRNMIPRLMQNLVYRSLSLQKIILILGARQVGKTTLVGEIKNKLEREGKVVMYLNCDIEEENAAINTTSSIVVEQIIANVDLLIIDEAQRLDNPGLTLKIIQDNFPKVRVIATGSSSFDLKSKMSDPLTGRYLDFTLYPLSLVELLASREADANIQLQKNRADAILTSIMIYGLYPGIATEGNLVKKQLFLSKIAESYLFKDILASGRVRNTQAVKDLTRALAYQVGSEVNENELANRLKIDRKTIVNYLDILEKAYVIVKVYPFSKNPRREIGRNYKVYFIDLGIRNGLIGDFNPLEIRSDVGFLWENFLFLERMKAFSNTGKAASFLFWRSYSGAEVDYIEKQTNIRSRAYEFKYNGSSLSRGARSFSAKYKLPVKVINKENYFEFIQSKH